MSKIYNKNAREKALLEEAYTSVYKEGEVIEEIAPAIGAAIGGAGRLLGKAGLTKAAAKKAAGKVGSAAVAGAAQGAKAGAAQKVQGMISGQPQPAATPEVPSEDEGAVDVELESWWEYDPHDVMVKVYHGALHALPPQQGTPQYEANFEKVFSWLEGKYPQHTEEVDAKKYQHEYNPGYGKVEDAEHESREERADVDKYEYEQGKEAGKREDHDKGVKMAHEALEMFKDELHVDGHGEDVNVNELADAHDQLSRALHWLLDETDVEYITGGRATQKAEVELDFKPAYGEY